MKQVFFYTISLLIFLATILLAVLLLGKFHHRLRWNFDQKGQKMACTDLENNWFEKNRKHIQKFKGWQSLTFHFIIYFMVCALLTCWARYICMQYTRVREATLSMHGCIFLMSWPPALHVKGRQHLYNVIGSHYKVYSTLYTNCLRKGVIISVVSKSLFLTPKNECISKALRDLQLNIYFCYWRF
jgi:hypothetical protein